jgi:hypothetical protein
MCGGSDLCGVWNFDSCSLDGSSWQIDPTSGASIIVSTEKARSGACSLKIPNTYSTGPIFFQPCALQTRQTTVSSIRFYMALGSGTGSTAGFIFTYSGGPTGTLVGNFSVASINLSTTYQLISGTFSTAGAADTIVISVGANVTTPTNIFIDDVQIN